MLAPKHIQIEHLHVEVRLQCFMIHSADLCVKKPIIPRNILAVFSTFLIKFWSLDPSLDHLINVTLIEKSVITNCYLKLYTPVFAFASTNNGKIITIKTPQMSFRKDNRIKDNRNDEYS